MMLWLPPQQIPIPGSASVLSMYAYLPGQREVILGVKGPCAQTHMQVIYQSDKIPTFRAGGGEVTPGGIIEKALGWVEWSVKDDNFGSKPCRVLHTIGVLTEKIDKKDITISDQIDYWVDADGKILRQYNRQVRPNHTRTANCVFHDDSIDVSVEDEHGRNATSIFPNIPMQNLHDQFKPMMVGTDVVLREKAFTTFDPFISKFEVTNVHLAGSVVGKYLGFQFPGKAFEFASPRLTLTASISVEGDLVKIDLPNDRSVVMQNVPNGKR